MHRYSRIESALLAFPGLLLVFNTTILQANLPVYARDVAPTDAAGSIEKNKAGESPKKVYSQDRKMFAYIKTSKDMVPTGCGDAPADVIYLSEAPGNAPYALFKKGAKVDTHQAIGDIYIGGIEGMDFSADGKELYFLCAAYAVSGAVLAIDLHSKGIRYVVDANSLEVVRDGKWKGNLIVQRHKYKKEGGAYEIRCVVSPQGKELKELNVVEY